jgi:hypothetical protein
MKINKIKPGCVLCNQIYEQSKNQQIALSKISTELNGFHGQHIDKVQEIIMEALK